VLGTVLERTLPWRAKSPPRVVLRVAVPVMLGLAAYVIASEGLRGLLALLPILGAHVLVLLVLYPLWLRYRRRRGVTTGEARSKAVGLLLRQGRGHPAPRRHH
jgi:hypothetical protein